MSESRHCEIGGHKTGEERLVRSASRYFLMLSVGETQLPFFISHGGVRQDGEEAAEGEELDGAACFAATIIFLGAPGGFPCGRRTGRAPPPGPPAGLGGAGLSLTPLGWCAYFGGTPAIGSCFPLSLGGDLLAMFEEGGDCLCGSFSPNRRSMSSLFLSRRRDRFVALSLFISNRGNVRLCAVMTGGSRLRAGGCGICCGGGAATATVGIILFSLACCAIRDSCMPRLMPSPKTRPPATRPTMPATRSSIFLPIYQNETKIVTRGAECLYIHEN